MQSRRHEPGPITFSLLLKHGVTRIRGQQLTADEKADMLLNASHLHLDRLSINAIDNLESMSQLTHLYLQHNLIERIENLECLTKLKFLALSNNRISKIENLRLLTSLIYLDLADNSIRDFDPEELPPKLSFLLLTGNPCVLSLSYRSSIIAARPRIKEIDEVSVVDLEKIAIGVALSDESSDDESESENEDTVQETKGSVDSQPSQPQETKDENEALDAPQAKSRFARAPIAIDMHKPIQSWYENATNMEQMEQQLHQRREERRQRAEQRNTEWMMERDSIRKRLDAAKKAPFHH
eukprot:TRINITY_DN4954_c0_g1_i2.p1 TRINITY_DN4954_c0_g1~~TRINITY_DN4954_c0_g1_i2.p1  ORF type:complete len:296 (+),score=80.97 TRINITY_DN4954_c0_g1_i2:139-1026(+)